MWFLFEGGEEADADFIRSVRLASSTAKALSSSSSSTSPSKQQFPLHDFVHDLSFWGVVPQDDDIHKSTKSSSNKRRNKGTNSQSSSSSSGGTSRQTSKEMRFHDRSRSRQHRHYNDNNDNNDKKSKVVWKTAIDPVSGRPYYYDAVTRKTQWNKPPEIKALERQRKIDRRKADIQFFKEMEKNLIASLGRGEVIPGIPFVETKKEGPPQEPCTPRARTISGMDEKLLAELRNDNYNPNLPKPTKTLPVPSTTLAFPSPTSSTTMTTTTTKRPSSNMNQDGRPPLPTTSSSSKKEKDDSLELSPDDSDRCHPLRRINSELAGEKLLDAPIHTTCDVSDIAPKSPPGGHARRNTGGTIYLQSTMSNPNIEATIRCICGVYRAHIVQSLAGEAEKSPVSVVQQRTLYAEIFDDDYEYSHHHHHHQHSRQWKSQVPSLLEVEAFYQAFYKRSQMEHDTIIMSLIYVERLIKSGTLSPRPHNWRSILFSCMVLASKVWDDLSMWNIDFSNVSASVKGLSAFSLRRINQLELCLLKTLSFNVKVPASEYAKYYFLIRTMLLRSGLMENVEKPLGKQAAFETLENKTGKYQETKVPRGRRTKSMDENFWTRTSNDKQEKTGPVLRDAVCLEQLMCHHHEY